MGINAHGPDVPPPTYGNGLEGEYRTSDFDLEARYCLPVRGSRGLLRHGDNLVVNR